MDTQTETLGQVLGGKGLILTDTAISDLFFNSMEAAQAESLVAGGEDSLEGGIDEAAGAFVNAYLRTALDWANIDRDSFVDALAADYLGRR